jgi:phosphonate transport system substrate-binding protein
MKKLITVLLFVLFISGCAPQASVAVEPLDVKEITLMFSPVVDPTTMLAQSQTLEQLIIEEMKNHNINLEKVTISVAATPAAVAEALESGAIMFGHMTPLSYLNYESEDVVAVLRMLRHPLNADTEDHRDWNRNYPLQTNNVSKRGYYYGAIIAGPSDYGRVLQGKVDQGLDLTWDDLKQAKFCIGSVLTSGPTYVYPAMWLLDNYNKSFSDFDSILQLPTYTEILSAMASNQCDMGAVVGFGMKQNESKWSNEWAGTDTIWNQTRVIGVTQQISNGLIVVSKHNEQYSDQLTEAFVKSMVRILETEAGQAAFRLVDAVGLEELKPSDLDSSRNALEFLRASRK